MNVHICMVTSTTIDMYVYMCIHILYVHMCECAIVLAPAFASHGPRVARVSHTSSIPQTDIGNYLVSCITAAPGRKDRPTDFLAKASSEVCLSLSGLGGFCLGNAPRILVCVCAFPKCVKSGPNISKTSSKGKDLPYRWDYEVFR